MTKEEKLALLGEVFELEEDEFTEETVLSELTTWDSMAKLSLIALMDEEFDKKITGEQLKSFVTIKDILDVME